MNFRRNEIYVAAFEESTDHATGATVIGLVAVPARWVRPAHAYWHRHLKRWGLPRDVELHATELAAGKGAVRDIYPRFPRHPGIAKRDHARRIGRLLLRHSLRRIASINEIRIGEFCIPTPRIPLAYAEAFSAVGAGIALRASSRGIARIGHTLIDGQDRKLPRVQYEASYLLYRSTRLPGRLRARNQWILGGATLTESHLTELIQMADIVAFAGLKAHLADPVIGTYAHDDLVEYASSCWRRSIDVTDSCIAAGVSAYGASGLARVVP